MGERLPRRLASPAEARAGWVDPGFLLEPFARLVSGYFGTSFGPVRTSTSPLGSQAPASSAGVAQALNVVNRAFADPAILKGHSQGSSECVGRVRSRRLISIAQAKKKISIKCLPTLKTYERPTGWR